MRAVPFLKALAALNTEHARAVYVDADHVDLLERAMAETDAALGAFIQAIKGRP